MSDNLDVHELILAKNFNIDFSKVYDDQNEIINSEETYYFISKILSHMHRALIGWTNGTTHYDILFVRKSLGLGNIQGGLKSHYLYVAIMRIGAFGFSIEDGNFSADYIGEKLFLGPIGAKQIADLISGVCKNIYNHNEITSQREKSNDHR